MFAAFTAEDILSMFPELNGIANIKSNLVSNMMSEDILFVHYKKIADAYSFSSSMDFASEYGFADDGDAKKLFFAALNMSGKIIVN